MLQSHFDNGLAENTLSSFNSVYHELGRFNRSLPAHQRLSDGVMAEKLSHVVCRIGESASTLLDVQIALSRATGQL
eukprot:5765634-Pleurochrysis_carterae.AAC.1